MIRAKKIFYGILIAFVAAFSLCSCGGDQPAEKTKYTLTVWGAENDQAMLKEMC